MISAWCIGSVKDLVAQSLTINGGAAGITAGSRYLYHPTAGLSLLAQIVAAMTAAGVAGASAVLLRNRKIKISAGGVFTLTWPVDNVLRNLLGFTGNLAAASTYTASLISPLLWSPARTESPLDAPLGSVGKTVLTTYHAISPLDGGVTSVIHGSTGRRYNRFMFRNIRKARHWTTAELGGEWVKFFEVVCARGYSFHLWRLVDEDDASTDAVTLSTSIGPYVLTPERRALDWKYQRSAGFDMIDSMNDLTLQVHNVPEYSA